MNELKSLLDLPSEIYIKAWDNILRMKYPGKEKKDISSDEIQKYDRSSVGYAFLWNKSKEGNAFWSKINLGDYKDFYNLYPKNILEEIEEEEETELFKWLKT